MFPKRLYFLTLRNLVKCSDTVFRSVSDHFTTLRSKGLMLNFSKNFIMRSIQHENLFSPSTNRLINAAVLFNVICKTFMKATVR